MVRPLVETYVCSCTVCGCVRCVGEVCVRCVGCVFRRVGCVKRVVVRVCRWSFVRFCVHSHVSV